MSGAHGPGLRKTRPWNRVRPGAAAARTEGSSELTTVVAFDVPSDKVRRKVCEICKDYGLTRLQWSVFEGPMTRNRREEIAARLEQLLSAAVDGGRFAVFPIGEQEARLARRWATTGVSGAKPQEAAGGNR